MIVLLKSHVAAYTKKDGTAVRPHEDKRTRHQPAKPTYVSRHLLNADELRAWAKEAGFKDITPADKMHCTVAYSKKPMHQDAIKPHAGNVDIPAGGERSIKQIGSDGAVVLRFESDKLQERWRHMLDCGASWDFGHTAGDYLTHVTISYTAQDLDISKVPPFPGKLVLGPEKVQDLKTGWSETLKKARPTPAQAEAGNYKKPRRQWNGLDIAIENPAGSVREGEGWRTKMQNAYGYICRSEAVDGDEVDVYLGPELDMAPTVYVVHQRRAGDWDAYDEDKCMLGFASEAAATAAYLAHYDDKRFLGPITAMPVDEFVRKVRATYDKPAMIKSVLFMRKTPPAS